MLAEEALAMSMTTPFFPDVSKYDGETALRMPLGAASPLWAAFAGMASAGVAYWWMTRWTMPLSLPTNIEAMSGLCGAPAEPAPEIEAATIMGDPAVEMDEMMAAAAESVETVAEAPPEPVPADVLQVLPEPDDLTKLVGIGPTLASKLSALGVTTYGDIASWGEDELAHYDKTLNLMGRAVREHWVDQAKQFM